MKKIAYTIFAAILIFAATQNALAQSEQTRHVSDFNGIASGGPFNVHVKIDGTESLKLVADSKIINEIETVVEDRQLKVKFKHRNEWNDDHFGAIDIYITAKSLSSLSNAGSGNMTVDGDVHGDNVKLSIAGSGDITTSVKSGNLHVSIAGSGSMHLKGHTGESKINIAGSGELLGKGFKTGSASVSIAGSGNAYFVADKDISAHIIGSGSVIYSGNATVSDSKTIGSGSISKAD